jgi:hypothetical protein
MQFTAPGVGFVNTSVSIHRLPPFAESDSPAPGRFGNWPAPIPNERGSSFHMDRSGGIGQIDVVTQVTRRLLQSLLCRRITCGSIGSERGKQDCGDY